MPTGDTEERTRAYADQLRAAYGRASTEGRQALLRTLATEHSGRPEAVHAAITRFEEASSSSSSVSPYGRTPPAAGQAARGIGAAAEALLSRVAREDGLPFLLELRKDLLRPLSRRRCLEEEEVEAEAEAEGEGGSGGSDCGAAVVGRGAAAVPRELVLVGLLLRRITYEESGKDRTIRRRPQGRSVRR